MAQIHDVTLGVSKEIKTMMEKGMSFDLIPSAAWEGIMASPPELAKTVNVNVTELRSLLEVTAAVDAKLKDITNAVKWYGEWLTEEIPALIKESTCDHEWQPTGRFKSTPIL